MKTPKLFILACLISIFSISILHGQQPRETNVGLPGFDLKVRASIRDAKIKEFASQLGSLYSNLAMTQARQDNASEKALYHQIATIEIELAKLELDELQEQWQAIQLSDEYENREKTAAGKQQFNKIIKTYGQVSTEINNRIEAFKSLQVKAK